MVATQSFKTGKPSNPSEKSTPSNLSGTLLEKRLDKSICCSDKILMTKRPVTSKMSKLGEAPPKLHKTMGGSKETAKRVGRDTDQTGLLGSRGDHRHTGSKTAQRIA
jgi:hypothetical protein